MDVWLEEFPVKEFSRGPGLQKEASVIFRLDGNKLALYGISASDLQEQVKRLFGMYSITDIKRFGEITPIRLKSTRANFEEILRNNYLSGKDGNEYALSNFIRFDYENHYKFVTADKGGIYQSVLLESVDPSASNSVISRWVAD